MSLLSLLAVICINQPIATQPQCYHAVYTCVIRHKGRISLEKKVEACYFLNYGIYGDGCTRYLH